MKFYLKPVLSVLVLAILLGYAGCGGDKNPGPSAEEVQLGKLNGTWKPTGANDNVTLEGVSKKAEYNDFTLQLSGTAGATAFNYSTGGRPDLSAWPASGSWKFGTDPTRDVVRDPDTAKEVAMTYSVSDTQLELTFNYSGAGEARTGQVTGTWIFKLTKQ